MSGLELAGPEEPEDAFPEPRLCDDCKAKPGLKKADGSPREWLMTVEEGRPTLRCPVEGCEHGGPSIWVDGVYEQITWAEKAPAVRVTVAVDSDCGDLGGYHFNGRCDHDWWFAITPVIDPAVYEWAVREAGGIEKVRRGIEFDAFPEGTALESERDGTFYVGELLPAGSVRALFIHGHLIKRKDGQ